DPEVAEAVGREGMSVGKDRFIPEVTFATGEIDESDRAAGNAGTEPEQFAHVGRNATGELSLESVDVHIRKWRREVEGDRGARRCGEWAAHGIANDLGGTGHSAASPGIRFAVWALPPQGAADVGLP